VIRLWGLRDPKELPWAQVKCGLAASVGLTGLTTISDWIASDDKKFPRGETVTNLSAYLEDTRKRATEVIAKLDWDPWRPPNDTSFRTLFPTVAEIRPIQKKLDELLGDEEGIKRGIYVIEAPTGEGKTRSALQLAAALVKRLGLNGFYIGLPTQATANGLFREVESFLSDIGADIKARLLHSKADEVQAKRRQTDPIVEPSDATRDEHPEAEEEDRDWLSRQKGMLFPVGVGTVDQSIKHALRARHLCVGLASISNKVIVVDEVHAYDTYMSQLLDRLLQWLGRLGVPVILLSATLPSNRRTQLINAWCSGSRRGGVRKELGKPSRTGYPRITYSYGDKIETVTSGVSSTNGNRVIQLPRVDEGSIVPWVLDRVRGGGCAAVIRNLVRSANNTYDALKAAIERLPSAERPEIFLLTSKVSDRQQVEQELLSRLGLPVGGIVGARPQRAIVVGTSVLESSLDLDFDIMVSDLAPIDSMIQRMGRLHRHERDDRPEHLRDKIFAITGVVDQPTGPRFPQYTINVYSDLILHRTWAVLRNRVSVCCPNDVEELIEAVYGEDLVQPPPSWERQFHKAEQRHRREQERNEYVARERRLPPPRETMHLEELTRLPGSSGNTRLSHGAR